MKSKLSVTLDDMAEHPWSMVNYHCRLCGFYFNGPFSDSFNKAFPTSRPIHCPKCNSNSPELASN